MNLSTQQLTELRNTIYACYVDGGDPYILTQHVLHQLHITVNNNLAGSPQCNWKDHVPGGRVYLQETAVSPS